MEKLALTLVCAAKRLRRYFQVHHIVVITDQPIKQVISCPDMAGRFQKQSVMLREHNITYQSRTYMKGQILADFLVEKPDDAPPEASVIKTPQDPWTLFTDGSSCVDGSGAGMILTSPEGTKFTYAVRFQFITSNNEAKYEALIAGLRIAAQMGVRNVHVKYLRDETLPDNRKEARKLRIKARQYELLEGILYRRSFLKPWLRCFRPLQADYLIWEIHEGSCSMHAGPRSVVAKAMRHPQQSLTSIMAPWPFYKWRIDIGGPFSKGSQKVKFLIDAMDYFIKEIVSDNIKQFSGDPFKDWCEKLNIVQRFASVKHPQSNELVEREYRSLGEGIKARLGEGNKNWLEELPYVLWSHRTMIKSNNDTSFSLTYGTEAVIPAEIRMLTHHTMVVDVVHNDEESRLNLDLLKERCERAAIREAKAKSKMTKYYNAMVKRVTFSPGDFVYRSNDASHAVDGGKLGSKWDGPYEVTETLGDEVYKLRSTDGTVLSRT
uniref:Reverse transcriptase domain-containing protein n=1 Tax=Tanacetum cinerariifolium TaxID=118510 RepID=A0A699JRQ0_TANCI|nr:reverse transcriptase domain-containing protein [Tanacetum cinerariifolium]